MRCEEELAPLSNMFLDVSSSATFITKLLVALLT